MNRVYLFTFHRPINFGAALQTAATYQFLKNSGVDVLVVDYRHLRIESNRKLVGGRWSDKKSLPGNLKTALKDIIDYKKEKSRQKKFDAFIDVYTSKTKVCDDDSVKNTVNNADVLLVGSDLVWNWELDVDLNKVFFLEFAKDINCKKISYASSIGSSYIPTYLIEVYRELLSNFDRIAVREESAARLLTPLTKQKIEIVVDPTLLLGKPEWEKFERGMDCPNSYILLYLLEESEEVSAMAKRIVSYFDLPVYYCGKKNRKYGNKQSVNYYEAAPEEFLYLLHHAEFIVTNSFHGTVFSVIYEKSFLTIPHSTRGSRMVDFLNEIGLLKHCCVKAKDLIIEDCLIPPEIESQERLNQWIEKSKNYLLEAVK